MIWRRGEWCFTLWPTGSVVFTPRLTVGFYLTKWALPSMIVLPGSTYCPGGVISYELGPLRVVWVRADDWEVVE